MSSPGKTLSMAISIDDCDTNPRDLSKDKKKESKLVDYIYSKFILFNHLQDLNYHQV